MPVYEYECPKCKTIKEVFLRSNYDYGKIPICGVCNIEMKKIISKNTFQLKGAGWTYRRKPTIEKG